MHVVHVYDGHERVHGGRGSVPNVVWNIARETAARGHDVTVLERQWEGLAPVADHEGVAFERIDLRTGADEPWERVPYEQVRSPVGVARLLADRTNFAASALARLRRHSFDVLHVHLPFAANVLVTVAPWLRSRTVYTGHLGEVRLDALTDDQRADDDAGGIDVPDFLSYVSPDVYLARRAAHTTVLNEWIREALLDRGVPAARTSVVPNGVDVGRFAADGACSPAVRQRYGIDGRRVVLFVGTIMPRKGVDDLVAAVERLVSERGHRGRDLRVILAGEDGLDEEYAAEVRSMVRERGLDGTVRMPGFVPEEHLPELYAAADVFAIPSREEGFGMTVTEAMAAGTPVVGTEVGAIHRQIDDGEQGLLVAPNDPASLADALDRLLSAPDRRTEMGDRAVERAETYSWSRVGREFERVYREVTR